MFVEKEFPVKKITLFLLLLLLFTAETHIFFDLDGNDHKKEAACVKSRTVS